jgi:hypothetical protein
MEMPDEMGGDDVPGGAGLLLLTVAATGRVHAVPSWREHAHDMIGKAQGLLF